MKFKIAKNVLFAALQRVQNVVAARTTLPILSNVLLNAEKGRISLCTTDLEVSVKCSAEASVQKQGATTLPARRLASIVRELPDKPIAIEVDDKNIATLECNSSYFKIIGMSEDEFPPMSMPEGQYTYALDQGRLKDMLGKTVYAASTDETRHVLNGALLNFKGNKLSVVATDGRRLALVEHEMEVPREAETEVVLPTKALAELMHTLSEQGTVKVRSDGNKIAFEFDDVIVTSKVIEGTYPNYRQVIPGPAEQRVTVERETLLAALKRVSLVTTDKANAARLTFTNNSIVVSTTSPDVGEARETVPVKYTGKDITVAFNPEYVMDPLRTLTCDEIYIEITDDLSPGVIKCETPFLYVLMPMRVT
ncbi:MAG: DNA polymerase III subunit beta [Lentisphaerae bacterium]|nr:DNA polymerase III subunit beta [Lentisphaerota bacterium]